MQRMKGRPHDAGDRQPKELQVYDLLDSLNIAYERIDHAPADTMELCREIDISLGAMICKNLFLCNRQKTRFYLLMIPADKPFHTRDLSPRIGCSRLSFAEPAAMERYLDTLPGSASVLGLMNDREHAVQLVIDKPVLESEWFGCHPCVNTSSLRLRTRDLLDIILPALGHEPIVVDLPEDGESPIV